MTDEEATMSAAKVYRKKPVTVEAMQWDGTRERLHELWDWVGADKLYGPLPVGDALSPEGAPLRLFVDANSAWLPLQVGEWILKDSEGFYPCLDSIFQRSYREAT